MFELTRTDARATFKDLLGQANHFLITILVGLNGVRSGATQIDEEFRTSWNARSVRRSAERSRAFALDLALVRAVDSLDAYMMRSRRRPFALTNNSFANSMDGTGQKISKRLAVFNTFLDPLPTHHSAFIRLAIDWRNRRVHSLAEDIAGGEDIESLQQYSEKLCDEFSGLMVEELIQRYKTGLAPTFKEAAAIIRLTHVAVAHFDAQLLRDLDIRRYLSDALAMHLGGHGDAVNTFSLSRSCRQIWDHPTKKEAKILRALRLIGIHPTGELKGRAVPDDLIDDLLRMTSAGAIDFLSQPAG